MILHYGVEECDEVILVVLACLCEEGECPLSGEFPLALRVAQ
jgi:hypothetical protein